MDALKILNNASFVKKRNLYPNVPTQCLVPTKFTDKNASGLTSCILEYFRLLGGYAVRINSQGQYNEKLGKWTKGTTTKGTADIHACLNGVHYSIEVKIGEDRQSIHQIETQKAVEAAGGFYFVAKDFSNFYEWLGSTLGGQRI